MSFIDQQNIKLKKNVHIAKQNLGSADLYNKIALTCQSQTKFYYSC